MHHLFILAAYCFRFQAQTAFLAGGIGGINLGDVLLDQFPGGREPLLGAGIRIKQFSSGFIDLAVLSPLPFNGSASVAATSGIGHAFYLERGQWRSVVAHAGHHEARLEVHVFTHAGDFHGRQDFSLDHG